MKAQREHFRKVIDANPAWDLVDIYWETASGTCAEARPQLQRLLSDCRAGCIDLVVTKSISRFARNTAECLQMVRELTALGVKLRFEREGIETGSAEQELLLTVLAALAQDESRSIAGNVQWGIRHRQEGGCYRPARAPYGYRKAEAASTCAASACTASTCAYVVEPNEARVVRRIFQACADGMGTPSIARMLDAQGAPTWSAANRGSDAKWAATSVLGIVRNPIYAGGLACRNASECTSNACMDRQADRICRTASCSRSSTCPYPAIVDFDTFKTANAMVDLRAQGHCSNGPECHANTNAGGTQSAALPVATTLADPATTSASSRVHALTKQRNRSCFSGRLRCGACGAKMHRAGGGDGPSYACAGRANGCRMARVHEEDVRNAFATMLNKLAFAEEHGVPVLGDSPSTARLASIDAQITDIAQERGLLHHRALAGMNALALQEALSALDVRARRLQAERALATAAMLRDPAHDLRQFVRARGISPVFRSQTDATDTLSQPTACASAKDDATAFSTFVNHATIWSNDRVEFHLTCGIALAESIERPRPKAATKAKESARRDKTCTVAAVATCDPHPGRSMQGRGRAVGKGIANDADSSPGRKAGAR